MNVEGGVWENEIRPVTAERTRITSQLDDLHDELRALRHLRHNETQQKSRETVLEQENQLLRAKFVLHLENERRAQQKQEQKKNEEEQAQQYGGPSDSGMDSVRLPTPSLLRAVRAAFPPGRVALDDDQRNGAVSIEFSREYMLIRGPPRQRALFMRSLLHLVLSHMESTHPASMGPAQSPFQLLAPTKGTGRGGNTNTNGAESRGEAKVAELVPLLRRAADEARMARERAEVALHETEHKRFIAESTLRAERARHAAREQEFEHRIAQLEAQRETHVHVPVSSHPILHISHTSAADARHSPSATASLSTQDVHPTKGPQTRCETKPPSPVTKWRRRNASPRSLSPPCPSAANETVELVSLRAEVQRLTQELRQSRATVQTCQHEVQNAEASAAPLCRDALRRIHTAPMPSPNDRAAFERVREAVVRLERGDGTLGERLQDVHQLLLAERRAFTAALDFARNERDAAREAHREASLLPPSVPFVETTHTPHSTCEATCATCASLRLELQRCFDDLRQLGNVLQRAAAVEEELRRQLRVSEQRATDAVVTVRRTEERHTVEVVAAQERAKALERQLLAFEPRQTIAPHANTNLHTAAKGGAATSMVDLLVTTPRRSGNVSIDEGRGHGSFIANMNKVRPSSVLRKENFLRDLDTIHSR